MSKGYSKPKVTYAEIRSQESLSSPPFLTTALPDGKPWSEFYRKEPGYCIRFLNLVDFVISRPGTEISIHPMPGVSLETTEHLLQNQAIPLARSLQKEIVLHGSAVEVGGHAVAFLAASGRGKSTLAASFASNGFRFLTDDGLLIDQSGDEYVIRPSHPSIRLWDDSCEAISNGILKPEPPIDYSSKAKFLANDQFSFCHESRPLGHVYFLGDGSSQGITIHSISSQKAVIEMIRHCFLLGVDEREMLAHNFQQLASLSRLPIFFTLDYPRRYDILGRVREAVVDHLHQSLQKRD